MLSGEKIIENRSNLQNIFYCLLDLLFVFLCRKGEEYIYCRQKVNKISSFFEKHPRHWDSKPDKDALDILVKEQLHTKLDSKVRRIYKNISFILISNEAKDVK